MAYFHGDAPHEGGGFWSSPLKVAVLALVLLPAIPAAVWCGGWAFKTFSAWSQGLGL